jgi:hypothetical protein
MSFDTMASVLRQALEHGPITVDGLGTFSRTAAGYGFSPETQPRVFIAYAVEDLQPVRRLCEALRTRGCLPWIDQDQLLPGQNWPRAIERAISASDAFIACLSPNSISKRGQFQSELRYALDCARRIPLDQVFVIPVRLEPCILAPEIADRLQYVDLFPDWERGIKRIERTLRRCARPRLGIQLSSI